MKHQLKLFSILIIAFSLINSCSNPNNVNSNKQKSSKDTVRNSIVSILADENYVFKNLKNTFVSRKFKFDKGKLYTDSTHKIAFVELTAEQKVRLIAPFIIKELGVKSDYIKQLMEAYFVSKQNKIGEFQPILIYIVGDDYTSLTLVLLDKNNSPVDGFNVSGGKEYGPTEIGDSLTSFEVDSYSFLEADKITTIKIDDSDFADSLKKPAIVDSTVFTSHINERGEILTKQTAKSRYLKPYRSN